MKPSLILKPYLTLCNLGNTCESFKIQHEMVLEIYARGNLVSSSV
jgi:hypothetical protein